VIADLTRCDHCRTCADLCPSEAVEFVGQTISVAEVVTQIEKDVAERTDLFLYDVKLMDAEKHRAYTGVSNEQILDNLVRLARNKVRIQVRIPIIPGINDDAENIDQTADFLCALPGVEHISILPFQFNIVDSQTLRQAQRTPDEHRDLLVRVAGYSDYFVDLDVDHQEEIIARTQHDSI
jgi:pyruvate-formate lyase-activating enzyme